MVSEYYNYEAAVKDLASKRSPVTHFNMGKEFGELVVENIMRNSGSVKICTDVLSDHGDKRFQSALTDFLLNKGKITILTSDFIENQENEIIDILKQFSTSDVYKNNIEIKLLDIPLTIEGSPADFTIGDRSMYCIEYNDDNPFSKFCFNDIVKTDELRQIFDRRFQKARQFQLL